MEEGQRPGKELRTRLNRATKYKSAFKDILAELSKGLEHKFPPADYQSPVSYESLRSQDIEPEDTVLVTSAGAPSEARQTTRPSASRNGLESAHGAGRVDRRSHQLLPSRGQP